MIRDRFAEDPPGQGGPAAAGVVRDHEGEPLVRGPGPEGRLAQPRMAHHATRRGVDVGVGLEVVHGPAQAPGPGGDRAPLVGRGLGLARAVEQRVDAVLEAVVEVGVDVAVVDRGQAVAAFQDRSTGQLAAATPRETAVALLAMTPDSTSVGTQDFVTAIPGSHETV